jgi:hypothetical protein
MDTCTKPPGVVIGSADYSWPGAWSEGDQGAGQTTESAGGGDVQTPPPTDTSANMSIAMGTINFR